MMHLTGVCLISHDVARLGDFYRMLLQVEPQQDGDNLDFSGTGLSVFSAAGMEEMASGSMAGAGAGACVLNFEVADVDAEYARLTALGVPVVKPPASYPWGSRSAWFRDPDGHIVNLYARLRPPIM